MSGKMISLTGELHMNSTGFSVTVEALETLKIIGIAYGVYDHAEDLRDCRVTLENGERPALVVPVSYTHLIAFRSWPQAVFAS